MQLTKFTDYALRVLMFLGEHQGLATIRQIAAAYDVSESHLMKVVQALAREGYIEARRGNGGGMRLSRAPDDITLGAVVRSMEQTLHVVDCLADHSRGECRMARGCPLKLPFKSAQAAFLEHLDGYTLRDMLPMHGPMRAQRHSQRAENSR